MRWVVVLAAAIIADAQTAEDARQLMLAGKTEQALPIYEALLRSQPNDAQLLVSLAIAEFKLKRYDSAAQHAGAARKLAPNSPAANLFLGASYVELGRQQDAIQPLETAVAMLPNDRNARLILAEAYFGSERYENAAEQLRQLSESLPDNPRVWYRLGQTYDALAERAFTELQKTDAESAYGYAVAGNLFLKQRRLGSAYAAYRESLSKGVAIPGVHAGLAQIYKETGHSDLAAAEAELERALQPIPPPRPYETFRRLAREAYDHLKLLPSSAEAHLQAARELDEHGQYVQAAAEWREALKLSPGNPDAQMRLAWALYRSRDYDSAMRELAAMPESADVSFLRGASLLNLEQPDKAVPYLERAVAAKPTFPSAQAALGQALLRVGKAEQAIPHLKAALPADEDGSTHFQLLRAYQQAGHEQLAQAALAEYQQFRAEFERKLKFEEGP